MDSMRGISNRSSGKMGVEIAKEAYRQGANVTLLCGLMHTSVPKVFNRIDVKSSMEMMDAVKENIDETDIYVSVAAISDFTFEETAEGKISSDEDVTIKLTRLPKILEQVKKISPETFVVAFKAEAGVDEETLISKAKDRMNKYDADIIVANDISVENSGPGSDNNEVYIIDNESYEKVDLDSKSNVAKKIVEKVCSFF